MKNQNKIFFASDFHIGLLDRYEDKLRERVIVDWLESIASEATHLFLVGDIFDYWFEYKHVIPKGGVRILGQLAKLVDIGVDVKCFTGNHDLWMFGYFEEELGIPVYRSPRVFEFDNKKFLVGHGDGLGPGDHGYKFIKRIFENKICQWLFARLHPNFAIGLMRKLSRTSRLQELPEENEFFPDKEWLVAYCEDKLNTTEIDFFVLGHRHLPIDYLLSNKKSRYINLGDWINHRSYALWDGSDMQLRFYKNSDAKIYS